MTAAVRPDMTRAPSQDRQEILTARLVALVLGLGILLSLGQPFLHDHSLSTHGDVPVSGWGVIFRPLPIGTSGSLVIHGVPVLVLLVTAASATIVTRNTPNLAALWTAALAHAVAVIALVFDFGAARAQAVDTTGPVPELHNPSGAGVGLWTTGLLSVAWIVCVGHRLRRRRLWA